MEKLLYFVAIIPSTDIQEKIRLIQTDFSKNFKTYEALKFPPHITLIPPIKLSKTSLLLLKKELSLVSEKTASFRIELNNFRFFPSRVVYIHVKPSIAIENLYDQLDKRLQQQPKLKRALAQRDQYPFIPHITIGFRDLSKNNFILARTEYKKRSFHANFISQSFTLLLYKQTYWEKVAIYPLAAGNNLY